MVYILNVRFNNETWEYNNNYRKNKNIACIYACPNKITSSIPYEDTLFVIEMNNSINQIIGIGMIKNKVINLHNNIKIQNDFNYNRYIYIGSYYICREILYNYNPRFITQLEYLLFKGKTHSKRGMGLTRFPLHLINKNTFDYDIKEIIKNIFIDYYKKETKDFSVV
jgi:hypothetical protein